MGWSTHVANYLRPGEGMAWARNNFISRGWCTILGFPEYRSPHAQNPISSKMLIFLRLALCKVLLRSWLRNGINTWRDLSCCRVIKSTLYLSNQSCFQWCAFGTTVKLLPEEFMSSKWVSQLSLLPLSACLRVLNALKEPTRKLNYLSSRVTNMLLLMFYTFEHIS